MIHVKEQSNLSICSEMEPQWPETSSLDFVMSIDQNEAKQSTSNKNNDTTRICKGFLTTCNHCFGGSNSNKTTQQTEVPQVENTEVEKVENEKEEETHKHIMHLEVSRSNESFENSRDIGEPMSKLSLEPSVERSRYSILVTSSDMTKKRLMLPRSISQASMLDSSVNGGQRKPTKRQKRGVPTASKASGPSLINRKIMQNTSCSDGDTVAGSSDRTTSRPFYEGWGSYWVRLLTQLSTNNSNNSFWQGDNDLNVIVRRHSKLNRPFRWSLSNYNDRSEVDDKSSLIKRSVSVSEIHYNPYYFNLFKPRSNERSSVQNISSKLFSTIKSEEKFLENGDTTIRSIKPKLKLDGSTLTTKLEKVVNDKNIFTKTAQMTKTFPTFLSDFKTQKNQSRFIFVRNLGEGSFGQVIECLDTKKRRQPVAIKITKKILDDKVFRLPEVDVLERIMYCDKSDLNPCISLIQWFKLEKRLCMVFNRYGDNLHQFMINRKFEPVPLKPIQILAYQLLNALLFLHSRCGLIHSDLKPENVVFTSPVYITQSQRGQVELPMPSKLDIKIIDFGNVCRIEREALGGQTNTALVGTRHYRALELILGIPWNNKVDYWSLGCILFELFWGRILFGAKEDNSQLALIDRLVGPIPVNLITESQKSELFGRNFRFLRRKTKDYYYISQRDSLKVMAKRLTPQKQVIAAIIINLVDPNPENRLDTSILLKSPAFSSIPEWLRRRYKIVNNLTL